MDVSRFELNPFGENTYILWHKTAKKAIVVDPGMMRDDERDLIVDFLDRHELTLQAVILTHIHIDHVTGAKWLADKYGVKILANKGDELLASSLPLQAQLFGSHLRTGRKRLLVDEFRGNGLTLPKRGS